MNAQKDIIHMNDSLGSRSLPDTGKNVFLLVLLTIFIYYTFFAKNTILFPDISTTTASLNGLHRVNSTNGSVH